MSTLGKLMKHGPRSELFETCFLELELEELELELELNWVCQHSACKASWGIGSLTGGSMCFALVVVFAEALCDEACCVSPGCAFCSLPAVQCWVRFQQHAKVCLTDSAHAKACMFSWWRYLWPAICMYSSKKDFCF